MKRIFNYPFFINTLISTAVIIGIVFILFVEKWDPCPMCIIQQLCVITIFSSSFFGLLKTKKGKLLSLTLICIILLASVIGIYVSTSQIWLQYFTNPAVSSDSCTSFSPTFESITESLTGGVQSCSSTEETIMGMTLAVYSAMTFSLLILLNIIFFVKETFRKKQD